MSTCRFCVSGVQVHICRVLLCGELVKHLPETTLPYISAGCSSMQLALYVFSTQLSTANPFWKRKLGQHVERKGGSCNRARACLWLSSMVSHEGSMFPAAVSAGERVMTVHRCGAWRAGGREGHSAKAMRAEMSNNDACTQSCKHSSASIRRVPDRVHSRSRAGT
eukprot:1675058-Pleurochrysis_carterae.AAC.3